MLFGPTFSSPPPPPPKKKKKNKKHPALPWRLSGSIYKTRSVCMPGALFPGDLECQDYGGLIGLIIGIFGGLGCLVAGV